MNRLVVAVLDVVAGGLYVTSTGFLLANSLHPARPLLLAADVTARAAMGTTGAIDRAQRSKEFTR